MNKLNEEMHLKAAKYTKPEVPIDHTGGGGGGGGGGVGRKYHLASGLSAAVLDGNSGNNDHEADSTTNSNNNNYQFTANSGEPRQLNLNLNLNRAPPPLPATTPRSSVSKTNSASENAYLDRAMSNKRSHAPESMLLVDSSDNSYHGGTNKLDRMKQLEVSIINLVELSSLAAEQNRMELALEKGKEALERLNSLKAIMMQENVSTAAKSTTISSFNSKNNSNNHRQLAQPMTTGVRLFELLLMVNSNLAAQLKNNGHLNEALDLYTELCKMATNSNSTANSIIPSNQQYDAKLLLYRFGLNIGNVLFQMEDYPRALKYYRLTLDRLSASPGQLNLRMKLMNNIAITQIVMGNQSDAINSLNLLLTDNLSQQQSSNRSQPQQQVAPAAAAANSQNVTTVCNSNHHRFALNLMVCQHLQQKQLKQQQQQRQSLDTNIQSTLKSLVKVEICHQYERVFDLDLTWPSWSAHAAQVRNRCRAESRADSRAGTGSGRPDHRRGRRASLRSSQQITTADTNTAIEDDDDDESTLSTCNNKTTTTTIGAHLPAQMATRKTTGTGESEPQPDGQVPPQRQTKLFLSNAEKSRQVMSTIREDRLEMLIDGRHRQICSVFITACNLLIKSANHLGNQQQHGSPIGNETSAFHYCLSLLATSETYRSLACDLRANRLSEMLRKRKLSLTKAKVVLEQIETEQEQQVESRISAPQKSTIFMSSQRVTAKQSNMILKSSFTNTNLCLLHMLKQNIKKAIEYGEFALKSDKSDPQTLLNLANCHYLEKDLNEAEALNEEAFLIDPDCLEAQYNALLIHRRLDRNYNELKPSIRAAVAKTVSTLSQVNSSEMVLSQVQLATLYYQSSLYQQSLNLLNELMANSRLAPEVYLMSCKSQENLKTSDTDACISILQQANREHPYSLPVLERLIAYNIQVFNYDKAKVLLTDCIKIRPDQHKWFQMLAECYRRAAEYSKAINIYKSAIERFPQEPSCLRSLLKLYDELGLEDERKALESRSLKVLSEYNDRMSQL